MTRDQLIKRIRNYAEARCVRPETVCYYATAPAGKTHGGDYGTWARLLSGKTLGTTTDRIAYWLDQNEGKPRKRGVKKGEK
jgi:hypothetical protein